MFFDFLDIDQEVVPGLDVPTNPSALAPLDQDLDRPISQPEQLNDGSQRPHGVDIIGGRVVGLGALLGGEQYLLVPGHRLIESRDAFLPADEQLRNHVGKHDDVAER